MQKYRADKDKIYRMLQSLFRKATTVENALQYSTISLLMHLKSSIIVKETLEEVITFFYDPSSLAQWDRSVAQMIPQTSGNDTSNATFDTIAPSGMKMTYEVIEIDPSGRSVKILLTKSKMFKKAIWYFEFEPTQQGTKVTCHIYFTLNPLYYFLYPVLFFNKKALLRDLKFFKAAVNDFTEKRKKTTIGKASQS